MSIFDGHRDAYGQFKFDKKVREDGKVKGSGVTIRGLITTKIWDAHLAGEHQLGIIPINEHSKSKFGAIDIDDYTVNDGTRKKVNALIKKYELPLVQFRSKSGGIHLYLFTKEFVSAALMQERLRSMAALLGYGNSEIFPKQSKLLVDRGDVGQWINIPYFKGEFSDRVAYDLNDNTLNIAEFMDYYDMAAVTGDFLKNFKLPETLALPGGPPCLQVLVQQGFPEGTRNNGLYNLAVYAMKAYPDSWPEKVEEYNANFMKPPLSSTETLTVVKSLRGMEDYNYSCSKQPICNFCNSALCRTRKHGIGQTAGLPVMGSLTKLESKPPIWFIEVENGGRLELTTDQLQNPRLFQKCCMDAFTTMPPVVTQQQWQVIIGELMLNTSVIGIPLEHTPVGRLKQHLVDFCVNRGTEELDALPKGMVWINAYMYHFRLTDFLQFLERKRFVEVTGNKIISALRDFGVEHKQLRVGVHNISVNIIPFFHVPEPENVPKQDKPKPSF